MLLTNLSRKPYMLINKKNPSAKLLSNLFGNDRVPEKILFVGLVLSIAWSIYFAILTIFIPYQIELREGTALVSTELLLNGKNPYNFENQPLGINVYGIGYSLVVLPFAFMFGNTLLVHRAITFIFIVLSAAVVFVTIFRTRKNEGFILSLLGGTFVAIGLIAYGGIGAFPASMGTFLFLVAVLWPFIKSFDQTSLFTSILLSLFAFYTKPYFVLAFGIVAAYLFLFVSQKKAITYGILFSFLFAALFVAVRFVFPLYFINVIAANISLTSRSYSVLKNNLNQMFLFFYPVLFLGMILLAGDLFTSRNRMFGMNELFDFSGPSDWDRPLFKHPSNYLLFSFLSVLLVFLFILGQHGGGTGMNYANQLVMPLYFCWLFQKSQLGEKLRFILVPLLLFNLFAWEQAVLNPDMLKQKDSKEWAELFEYVRSSSNILNSPVIVSEVIKMGMEPVDSGQTIIYYEIGDYPYAKLIGWSHESILADGVKYTKEIDLSIKKQSYDLIFLTNEKAVFYHDKYLDKYYFQVAKIKVDMPQTGQRWTILVWKPLAK